MHADSLYECEKALVQCFLNKCHMERRMFLIAHATQCLFCQYRVCMRGTRCRRVNGTNSSRTHVRLGAWFWSAQADIFFSESLHSTLRSGRRKTIVSQTMCALAEHLSQSEIELSLRNTCYYSPLAEVGVSTQTEMNLCTHKKTAIKTILVSVTVFFTL